MTVIIELLKESPVEEWCHHGPFAKGDNRYSHPHDDLNPDTDDDESAEEKATKAYHRLLDLLLKPRVELNPVKGTKDPEPGDVVTVVATCYMPRLDLEASSVVVKAEHYLGDYHIIADIESMPMLQQRAERAPERPGTRPGMKALTPERYKAITDDKTGRVTGFRAAFSDEKVHDSKADRFFVYLSHTTPEGFQIPSPETDAKATQDEDKRNFATGYTTV